MKNKLFFTIAIVATILTSSCSKNDGSYYESEPIFFLRFKTYDDFIKMKDSISKMPTNMRLDWENAQGFTSFATKSDNVYTEVANKYQSFEELEELVQTNNQYIELEYDKDGECTLENKMRLNSKKYLININRIVAIGDTAYKILDNAEVAVNIWNIDLLNSINEDNYTSYFKDSLVTIIDYSSLKDAAYNYGTLRLRTKMSSDKKQRIRMETEIKQIHSVINRGMYFNYTAYFINHNKKLGAWIKCKRTITADVKAKIDYFSITNNQWSSYTLVGKVKTEAYDYTISHTWMYMYENSYQLSNALTNEAHFGALKCLFRNGSTDYGRIYYNEDVLSYNTSHLYDIGYLHENTISPL